ncbi:MAG TPA: MFS transporter [Candidatus Angelobacter sp.]|nr:MFS transporter [Candidatus Angelobacter sp.]
MSEVRTPFESPAQAKPASAAAAVSMAGGTAVRRTLAAFRYRDFKILWLGSCTSSIGTWMQNVAENWLVLSITGSAFYLGLDAFLQQLPIMLFSLLGGVLADRFDRRRTLLVSQYIQMSTAFTLAVLVFNGLNHVWPILTLSFITGSAQAFGGPASQALVPTLVEKNDLPNAIALNSIQFNLARVVGPLLAGLALATLGRNITERMTSCFSLNGLSFLVVIVALLMLHVKHTPPVAPRRISEELKGGLHYVRREGSMMALTILAFATTFLAFAVLTFLPLFAKQVFHQGVGEYTRLMAFSGSGSVVGAIVVAWLGKYQRMGRTALIVQAMCGLLIAGFALSNILWLSDLLLFFTGAALIIVFATITSLVQLVVPNELRGRVMSIYMVAFRGGMPLGSLVSGYFASKFGAPIVLIVNGILLAIVASYFLVRSHGVREL